MSWFVVNRLFIKNDFKSQFQFFIENLQAGRFCFLIIAVLLMPINWMIETLKWKILLGSKTPYWALLKSVVAGISVGFVTPGRSGEFMGRVLFLEDDNKTKAFYISSIGGFAQTAASLVTGVPFVYLWSGSQLLTEITAGAAAIYILVYFRFDLLNRLIASIPVLQKYGLTIGYNDIPDINVQVKGLLLSFLRFFIYSSQYVLLLLFFGAGNEVLQLTVHSIVFLLVQTFSPLMPLLDISFRNGSALYVFKNYTADNLAVLSAVTMVWLLNLVVPAIAGYLFIFKRKWVSV